VSYYIELRRTAQKELDRLQGRDYEAVATVISRLKHNPRPPKVKKLAESGLWRIRVGSYRVIYAIDDERQLVTIVRVARRSEATYRRL